MELADALVASADGRLAPAGLDIPGHFLLVARRLAEVELALAVLQQPSPADDAVLASRAGDASYAAMEAALAFWGLAVRLRARLTGLHGARIAAQLRGRLLEAARDVDADAAQDGRELLGDAARSLVLLAVVAELAEHEDHARRNGVRCVELIEQSIGSGVLGLVRFTTFVQENPHLS